MIHNFVFTLNCRGTSDRTWCKNDFVNPIPVTRRLDQSKPGCKHRHSRSGDQFDTNPTGIGLKDYFKNCRSLWIKINFVTMCWRKEVKSTSRLRFSLIYFICLMFIYSLNLSRLWPLDVTNICWLRNRWDSENIVQCDFHPASGGRFPSHKKKIL